MSSPISPAVVSPNVADGGQTILLTPIRGENLVGAAISVVSPVIGINADDGTISTPTQPRNLYMPGAPTKNKNESIAKKLFF